MKWYFVYLSLFGNALHCSSVARDIMCPHAEFVAVDQGLRVGGVCYTARLVYLTFLVSSFSLPYLKNITPGIDSMV